MKPNHQQYIIIERFTKEFIYKHSESMFASYKASELFSEFKNSKLYENFKCLDITEKVFISGLRQLERTKTMV